MELDLSATLLPETLAWCQSALLVNKLCSPIVLQYRRKITPCRDGYISIRFQKPATKKSLDSYHLPSLKQAKQL